MCGIAGCVVPRGETPDRRALGQMADALAPRGPDGCGVAIWENVGLVNRRLAIVDPSPAGAQPMADPDERWLISFNGEVYNHQLLRGELPPDGWRGHSDTETLCRVIAAWGPSGIERCNGPLALAALDRAERRMILARDGLGKKPLYISRQGEAIWFASEIRALLAAGLRQPVDTEVLAHMATRGWAHGGPTPLRGIEQLTPGTMVTFDLETLSRSERRWYDPAEAVDSEFAGELAGLGRAELADRLEAELQAAVRRRLMSDVPVGTFCSGGLDSSLVTALARGEQRAVTAFTCSLPQERRRLDEARWAERVAVALDIELHTSEMTAAGFRAALVEAVRLHEYPLHNSGSVPISSMAGLARDRGVKVLLTGEGADELFGGYAGVARRAVRKFLPRWLTLYRDATSALIWRGPVLRETWRSYTNASGDRLGADLQVRLGPDLQAAQKSVEFQRVVEGRAARSYSHHSGPRAEVEAGLLASLSCWSFPFLLNRMDKDAMGRSVETRLPFVDPSVVRLALNLPLEARTYPRLKGILRDVGRRHLPRAVAIRPKQGGMAFDARRRIEEAARPGFLQDGLLRELLGVRAERWRQLTEAVTPRIGFRLWTGEIWARLFVEGASAERVESELWTAGAG